MWREKISSRDLMTYLEETFQAFVDFVEREYPYLVEDFLDEHSDEYCEWIQCELGGDVFE